MSESESADPCPEDPAPQEDWAAAGVDRGGTLALHQGLWRQELASLAHRGCSLGPICAGTGVGLLPAALLAGAP